MSDETPAREGLCVYCATPRPVDKAICPECGRTWIDTKIGEELPPLTPGAAGESVEDRKRSAAAAAALAAAAAREAEISDAADAEAGTEQDAIPAADEETTEVAGAEAGTEQDAIADADEVEQEPAGVVAAAPATTDGEDGDRKRPWGLLIGALIGLAAVSLIFSFISSGDDGEETATPAPTSTTAPPTTETPSTTEPTTTTTEPTTTTTEPTTTTTTTTTTTLPPIEPEGNPVPIDELTLGAFALGPFGFNASTSYLGRLVASLGQPDAMIDAGVDLGMCPEDEGTAYAWDGLIAIFEIIGEQEILVGYRLDDTGSDHPTQQMTSRSGLELGHTVETLDNIYLQSQVVLQEIEAAPHFLLLRSSDSATLLWGPVTSADPSGVVEGIYSPEPCDGGPGPDA